MDGNDDRDGDDKSTNIRYIQQYYGSNAVGDENCIRKDSNTVMEHFSTLPQLQRNNDLRRKFNFLCTDTYVT